MKILSMTMTNFQSYPSLGLEFNEGLTLISGPTGVGKSTVMDAVAWCLYGVTAKGVASDQVVAWGGKNTSGIIMLESNGEIISIQRCRAPNLLHLGVGDNIQRGKDLKETQELINDKLGVDYDSFVAGSYFNTTSPVCTFFLDKAKERRELFEKLTDLSFPDALREKSGEMAKKLNPEYKEALTSLQRSDGKMDSLVSCLERAIYQQTTWEQNKVVKIKGYNKDAEHFSNKKVAILEELDKLKGSDHRDTCPTCKQLLTDTYAFKKIESLRAQLTSNEVNLTAAISRIKELQNETSNPYLEEEKHYEEKLKIEANLYNDLDEKVQSTSHKLTALQTLQQIASTVRASLLEQVIQQVQDATNEKLSRFFDAELTVTFTVEGDNLNTTVYKGEYEATFKQLSKGQQQLLKLSFGTSVMEAVSESSGVKFENLFFDEALDGLDPSLKVKAFPLFQTLLEKRTSIMVIDHAPEFQSLFSSVYEVTAENGKSKLNYE